MAAAPGPTGVVLVDKPNGLTSHDVVARARRIAGTRKVGHAGTLDPMATGLLILGIGSSTRLLTYIVGVDKDYAATIRLGQATSTDDAEGEITATAEPSAIAGIAEPAIAEGVAALTGDIEQVPSTVSAIKVGGKRAYKLAREGEQVTLAARPVTISAFIVDAVRRDTSSIDIDVRVTCSSGTYVRALARDLGAALGVGGHLTALRRTRVGPFPVTDAVELQSLAVPRDLVAPSDAASRMFPSVELTAQQAVDLGHGKRIAAAILPEGHGPIAAISPEGRLVGLVERRGDTAKSIVNFPDEERSA
ncbi:tRNA pseudouridine synthase B [Paramicrobacterium humi]|uniref:tRNA pseudouridine synthase B n=1 Tax=Paramicrobacterium humi TaxID=640635 RepID=A0A1H4PJV6_9MICO|nr:tRNA pseudouridine(55) synthase TruB [Microbacterium humi]SEC07538.1 tRNA pseudouridine synthase B [Microbacterium humi]